MLNALDPDDAARWRRRGGEIERDGEGRGVFEVGGNDSADAPKREEDAEDGLELGPAEDGKVALLGRSVADIAPGILSAADEEELPVKEELLSLVALDVNESLLEGCSER